MRNTFNRNKAKLTVAAMAAGLGLHLATHAQAANEAAAFRGFCGRVGGA